MKKMILVALVALMAAPAMVSCGGDDAKAATSVKPAAKAATANKPAPKATTAPAATSVTK